MLKYCAALVAFTLVPFVTIHAQTSAPAEKPQSSTQSTATQKPDYSKEAFLDEHDSTKVVFENDGSNTRELTARVKIQSDAGVQRYGVLTFSYQSAVETVDINYVRVVKPDGTVITTPSDDVQDMPAEITRQAPFYSDLHEKHVAVKGLSAGDFLEMKSLWRSTKPLAPGQFWISFNFTRDCIVLSQEIEISVPRDRAVKWKSPGTKPAITEEGSRRIFKWAHSELEPKSAEEQKKQQEEQTYQQARGKLPEPDIQFSSFQSWEEIGSWYNQLQSERLKPNDEVRAKALELTKGAKDDDAKLRAIYNYVSTQFRYIGVAFGIGRYQPHSAAEVLANQYGDCKDKHTLLASLLDAVGIKAYPALINSSHALDAEVPSPSQFDHVITAVPQGNGYVWLDATAEVAPYGYLLSPLWDKQALVIPVQGPPNLMKTPAEPPNPASETFRIDAKLKDDGTLEGKIERSLYGDDSEVILRSAFRSLAMPQWKDLVQRMSYGSGFAGDVSDASVSPLEKFDEPLRLNYSYNRKDFPQWTERRISSPLPPLLAPPPDEKPSFPIVLGAVANYEYQARVQLPSGYSPQLPNKIQLKENFAEFQATYSFENGVLQTVRKLVVKQLEVSPDQYQTYKKFAKAVSDDTDRYIELASGNAPYNPAQRMAGNLPASDNSDAMNAFADAMQAVRKGDVAEAIEALNDAVDDDPKFARAWIALTQVYATTGNKPMALQTLEKAYAADSDDPVIYKALVSSLISEKRKTRAIAVLREVVKSNPTNVEVLSALGTTLYDTKEFKEAVPVLESAVKLAPKEASIYLQLGYAYIGAGEEEKGLATYKKSLELNPTPDQYNSVGYYLAEANKELPLALEYAEKAVHDEEESSSKLDLSDLKREDLAFTNNLTAHWDTLGWVYFRMGNLEQAEKYMYPAWQSSQYPVMADHLGQIYEQQHKKQEALRMYRLALAASPAGQESEETKTRLEHLGGTTKSGRFGENGAEELSSLRSFELAKITSETASAEFFILFGTHGKVDDVKFVSGSEKLKTAEKVLKSTNFKISVPDDGPEKLLRRGVLTCSALTGCQFVLYTPDLVKSVN